MAVSFRVSKKGTRFRPKPKPESPSSVLEDNDKVDAPPQLPKIQPPSTRKRQVDETEDDDDIAGILDAEVSFILNIFPDGYTIKNPSEGTISHENAVQYDPKLLCPYNRTSENLFAAIECGRLPADFLDDIPFKYNNGAVVCEVRDYREQGVNGLSTTSVSPCITKVSLKMSLNNVVKDMDQISDISWTYGSGVADIKSPKTNTFSRPNSQLKQALNQGKLDNVNKRARSKSNHTALDANQQQQQQQIVVVGSVFDRFSKIRMLGARIQPNRKRKDMDEYRASTSFPTPHLFRYLFNDDNNNKSLKDDATCEMLMPLSMSVVGGSKTRVLEFSGNGVSLVPKLRTRLMLSEKTSGGSVAMHYGELDDSDYLLEELLPNTHTADLFAAEFCSQMVREGHRVEGDHIHVRPKPMNMMVQSSGGQPNNTGPGLLVKTEIHQILGSVSGQNSINQVAKPSNDMPSSSTSHQQSSLYHQHHLHRSSNPLPHFNSSIHQLGNYNVLPQQLEILHQQARNQSNMMMMGMGQLTPQQAAAIMANRMVQESKTNVTGGQSGNITGFPMMGYGIGIGIGIGMNPIHMQRNVMDHPYMNQYHLQQDSTSQSLSLPHQQINSGAVYPHPHINGGGRMDL